MGTPPDLETLLQRARHEANRFGHAVVSPIHVALVLAKSEPVRFERAFGTDARRRVEQATLRLEPVLGASGDDPKTVALFAEAARSTSGDAVLALLERLAPLLRGLPRVGAPRPPAPRPPTAHSTRSIDDIPYPELRKVPKELDRLVESVDPGRPVLGRDGLIRDLVSALSQHEAKVPLIVGAPGAGRTATLAALEEFLAADAYDGPLSNHRVLRLKPEAVVASERANTLRRVRATTLENTVLAMDDLEVLCALDGDRADADMLGVVGAMVADPEWRIVMTITQRGLQKLETQSPALLASLKILRLDDLSAEHLEQIGAHHAKHLGVYHGVTLPADVLPAALTPKGKGDQREHPGLLVDRLDRACARAGLRPAKTVKIADLELPSGDFAQTFLDREALYHSLLKTVVGQDHVIDRICDRLALTKARLDLKPGRPDGVFLLVGPTGVGKTLTAQAIQGELHGDDALIRLDMSEYAEAWALSRLIGPQPGYVGFTEPDNWLTTRVRDNPKTVVLLDEIEKAHPTVWNAFLQVFDAGRLTDSRGVEANFKDVVIMMTSNLGAEIFTHDAIGFGDREASIASQGHTVLETVKRTMPPELVNRLDEILVFRPLSRVAIRDIAQRNIADMVARIGLRGYRVQIDPAVIDFVADAGYEPAYGARHLARNIERLLLEPLASGRPAGAYRASVEGETIAWSPWV